MSANEKQRNKYVTFKSGNEYFGLKIEYVNEIVVYQEITQVPETPEYIKGLINLRGKIIPVIDVRTRFKMEPVEYSLRCCNCCCIGTYVCALIRTGDFLFAR